MKSTYIYIILIGVLVAGIIFVRNNSDGSRISKVTAYDDFAQCLGEAGAKFYGTFWCPHCQSQKKLFDNSAKLPYIECSTPNGQGQLPICAEVGITSYPTWIFADETKLEGEQTLSTLAEKTSCELPNI